MGLELYFLLFILFSLFIGITAIKKGYAFWNWFFAGSFLGFMVLFFLADLNKLNLLPSEKEELKTHGNRAGIIISFFSVAISFLVSL